MPSKHSKKLVEIVMRESKAKSFGKYLSCHKTRRLEGNATAYTYHVPDHLCRVYKTSKLDSEPVFSTSAILAVFDEFSTYGLMSQCKTSRGGVSVHLSTEIVGKAIAGEEVVLKTSSDKIGKALGFCTMELQTSDGRLLARGKHIKYMPMGSLWDFIASPVFLPITLAIYEYLTTTSFGKYLLSLFTKKKNNKHSEATVEVEKDMTGVGAVFAELGVKPIDYSEAGGDASRRPLRGAAFEFKAGRHLHNLMDKLHGGAVAAAIEEACLMSRRKSDNSKPGVAVDEYFVQSMEVRYLAPMKGELIITCEDDEYSHLIAPRGSSSPSSSRTTGRVVNKKSGMTSVEYVCHWKSADALCNDCF